MDVDGFLPDLTDETSVSEVVYQVTVTTSPGLARFEASLTYTIKLDTFSVKVPCMAMSRSVSENSNWLVEEAILGVLLCVT